MCTLFDSMPDKVLRFLVQNIKDDFFPQNSPWVLAQVNILLTIIHLHFFMFNLLLFLKVNNFQFGPTAKPTILQYWVLRHQKCHAPNSNKFSHFRLEYGVWLYRICSVKTRLSRFVFDFEREGEKDWEVVGGRKHFSICASQITCKYVQWHYAAKVCYSLWITLPLWSLWCGGTDLIFRVSETEQATGIGHGIISIKKITIFVLF